MDPKQDNTMDLHSFRIIANQLGPLLEGGRIEKIHSPLPGVYVFSVFTRGHKLRLISRHERKQPLLFLSRRKLENPMQPPAKVMLLRKHGGGRRINKPILDPASRSLAFPIPGFPVSGNGEQENAPKFLLFDMVHGVDVVSFLPPSFGKPLLWPDFSVVDALCESTERNDPQRDSENIWQQYAVLTPLLRETLARLDPMEGRALLVDLENGDGELFFYSGENGEPVMYCAWPLPDEIIRKRRLTPVEAERVLAGSGSAAEALPDNDAVVSEANHGYESLFAASAVDEARFFADVGALIRKEESVPEKKREKKRARLLAKLAQEEKRLTAMKDLREKALLLQEVLWQYPSDAKLQAVQLPERDGLVIALDPRLTVRENMAHMFHQSGRGIRGLAMLEQRKAALDADTDIFPPAGKQNGKQEEGEDTGKNGRKSGKSGKSGTLGRAEKDIASFTSADGFVILRGKSSKGNLALLKSGKGHDLWLHVEGGPGAHVLIRRSHEAEAVPESTVLEAAALAAEKSWNGTVPGAGVMVALLKHIHPIKNAAPGTVRIDALQRTVVLNLQN